MSFFSKLFRGDEPTTEETPSVSIRQQELETIRITNDLPELDENGEDPLAKMVYARIIEYPDGYGYEICIGGVPAISQRYDPEREGNTPMTEETAQKMADRAMVSFKVF